MLQVERLNSTHGLTEGRRFMWKFFVFCLSGAFLIYLDFRMSDYIGRMKEAEVADYHSRLPDIPLDFHGPDRQGCIMESVFYIYTYQTCFFLERQEGNGNNFFLYVYHSPVPFISLTDRSEDARYYYNEPYLGKTLAIIREPM